MMTADAMGGVWFYALELAAALGRCGVATLIAAMGQRPSPAQLRAATEIQGLELEHRPYRLEWMPDCAGDLAAAEAWLLALADRFRPDIVQINGYAAAALPWGRPVVIVCHSCVRSWWQAVRRCDAPAEWQPYNRRVSKGLAAANAVIAPTAAFLATIESLYGPLPASAVIHNGRRADLFRAGRKEPLIVSAGRLWDAAKNVTLLETVAPRLPWPVYVAGPHHVGETHARKKGVGASHGEKKGVGASHARKSRRTALGPKPSGAMLPLGVLDEREMAEWLGRAAIFALPARYEPFGLAVLEAALSECALVLGDIPTLRELWQDAALFVDPDNGEGLEAALRRLIDDPALRKALGAAAARRARQFSMTDMTEKYLAVYWAVYRRAREAEDRRIRLLHSNEAATEGAVRGAVHP
jgi:glycosyltransferase involved in cell wall biosynthesis